MAIGGVGISAIGQLSGIEREVAELGRRADGRLRACQLPTAGDPVCSIDRSSDLGPARRRALGLQQWAAAHPADRLTALLALASVGMFLASVLPAGMVIHLAGPAANFPIAAATVLIAATAYLSSPAWRRCALSPSPNQLIETCLRRELHHFRKHERQSRKGRGDAVTGCAGAERWPGPAARHLTPLPG